MAQAWQKGLGGAASGAGIGATVGGPYGAIAGGAIGGLLGLFNGNDSSPSSPLFSDINLARDNPQLWAEIQKNNALISEAQRMYNNRRQGMTYGEKMGLEDALANQRSQQAYQGTLGSSVGVGQQAMLEARLRDSIANRALQEQQALYNQYAQAQGRGYEMTRQGIMDVMGQNQGAYNQARADEQASNQFYGSLLGGGLQMLGGAYNRYQMDGLRNPASAPTPGFGLPATASNATSLGFAPDYGLTGGQVQTYSPYRLGVNY